MSWIYTNYKVLKWSNFWPTMYVPLQTGTSLQQNQKPQEWNSLGSLVVKDLAYEAKDKNKTFMRCPQGQGLASWTTRLTIGSFRYLYLNHSHWNTCRVYWEKYFDLIKAFIYQPTKSCSIDNHNKSYKKRDLLLSNELRIMRLSSRWEMISAVSVPLSSSSPRALKCPNDKFWALHSEITCFSLASMSFSLFADIQMSYGKQQHHHHRSSNDWQFKWSIFSPLTGEYESVRLGLCMPEQFKSIIIVILMVCM